MSRLRSTTLYLSSLCSLCLCGSTALPAEPTRLTADGSFKQHLQWSPDGKTLLFTRIHEGKMALWTMPAAGGEMRRLLPEHKEPHFDGHFSPDGKRVVYVYDKLEGTDGKLRINACNADGTDDKTVVPHKGLEESPRWSPDGKTIAFTSGRGGRQKVYVMKADGTEVKKLTDGDFLDAWPAWRPDGKKIAFVSNRSGDYDLWLMAADGAGPVNLTNHPGQDTSPAWSPDGKKLAFVSTRHGGSDVYVLAPE